MHTHAAVRRAVQLSLLLCSCCLLQFSFFCTSCHAPQTSSENAGSLQDLTNEQLATKKNSL